MGAPSRILRVGIIGCVEITQVVFISTLGFLADYFQITYLYDHNKESLEHCRKKVVGGINPAITQDAEELCASPDVDVVLVMSNYEEHVAHTVLALKYNKSVMVEKPLAMSLRDADIMIEAEKQSQGKIFVGYIRRYAPAFLAAVKEVGEMDNVLYARVRDIIGPNKTFIEQSGTFPTDFSSAATQKYTEALATERDEILNQALDVECGIPATTQNKRLWSLLGGLGCHDLSAMREALGTPISVAGVSFGNDFWNVLFQYPSFSVAYESGLTQVPIFDAHIEIYSANKIVRVSYDSAFIKGALTTLQIKENVDGVFRDSHVRHTYEDEYTLELKDFYAAVVEGKEIKTSARDARQDLEIFGMILKAYSSAA